MVRLTAQPHPKREVADRSHTGPYHLDSTHDPDTALKKIQTSGSISISPELFEKIYLGPQNKVAGDLRKTFGNPTPVYVRPLLPQAVQGPRELQLTDSDVTAPSAASSSPSPRSPANSWAGAAPPTAQPASASTSPSAASSCCSAASAKYIPPSSHPLKPTNPPTNTLLPITVDPGQHLPLRSLHLLRHILDRLRPNPAAPNGLLRQLLPGPLRPRRRPRDRSLQRLLGLLPPVDGRALLRLHHLRAAHQHRLRRDPGPARAGLRAAGRRVLALGAGEYGRGGELPVGGGCGGVCGVFARLVYFHVDYAREFGFSVLVAW